ncbi:TPA: M16 family metallopeptidase [Klebsiella pneumoniae]|uniref:M16 family metallopeptidase n=1 Tax=Klebsiella TaxID=570 RepID=UPI00058E197D|nr:pitrilysin family protein [Klebsiella pneumoniae]ATQ97355.1 insulinase family protein [Klebsiella pneumoniae]ATR02527.1 insulinase family protein [Klebsiella pneumoniae]ATR07926.1 insulinase family protein [Klebsiella pneumoniae]ATR13650.1 insulinase family protein [Klebsiella pneumoniae]EKZ5740767.1 insulinase family protein [Klebsiella pneumoniae]
MQGTTIKLLTGGLLMVAAAGYVQAEALQPDPAWQQGTLANGLSWQVLATPQRPSDRIEVRLSVNNGSLSESTQQSGFSRFIPRLALTQSGSLPTMQARSLWQQSIDPKRPLPPAIVSYDYTMFNLSLPNNRNDLLKEALSWLADASGKLAITPESINHALQGSDMVATWPLDTKEGWWRYRLKGSTMLGHDPAAPLKQPIDVAQLKDFYQKWYTPDAMTLIVVGNVDSRSVAEQINKTFGDLKGKRETPAAVPTLSPLPTVPVSIMTNAVRQDKLSIMWDAPWQPIRDSAALQRYWRDDLAREALFWHVQQSLSKNNVKDIGLGFDCRVLYQRAQCAINIDSPGERLNNNLSVVSRELAKVRDNGLPQEEFDALIAQKSLELQKLFATYARTDTDILMSQRMRSLQNQVVDIAPEQYQKLRQEFLNSLTVDMLNQYLRQQLSQDMALVLQQPKGEPEYNMKELQATWEKLMAPNPAATAASGSADTVDAHSEASDIPPGQ